MFETKKRKSESTLGKNLIARGIKSVKKTPPLGGVIQNIQLKLQKLSQVSQAYIH